jgi:hypothetical protein
MHKLPKIIYTSVFSVHFHRRHNEHSKLIMGQTDNYLYRIYDFVHHIHKWYCH